MVPETQSVATVYPLSVPSAANAAPGMHITANKVTTKILTILRIDVPISSTSSEVLTY